MTEVNITVEDVQTGKENTFVKLVTIVGQLDESNVDEKSTMIYELISKTPANLSLIFNLENLEYMNSKSIGYLTDWYGKISSANGKMVIVKAKPNVADVLQVVGLTQLIPIFNSLEEAKFAVLNDAPATPEAPAAAPQA
ncbi:MAG: anti-sigma F factor antagonist [Candidatus Peregrinibacteria bacterium GW2011_GWF2_38_29]|nr:MAG: anti-sigma F factor antagonist [Candidatus Peregrinibacteria bacterium GW2011_GWF2_38_29]HBB02972.1 hypothetical protein [Candidatus Peregrinibacteria bacterium]